MSQFTTKLDSIIVSALAKLPKGAEVLEVKTTTDKKGVEVVWQHNDFKTGYLTPFEWSESQLASQELPQGVKILTPQPVVVPDSTLAIKVDSKPKKVVKATR